MGSTELEHALTLVQQYGHHAGRMWFSGAEVAADPPELVVYRVPSTAFDREIASLLPPELPLRMVDAEHSREELRQSREVIIDVRDAFDLVDVRVPDDGSRLLVTVRGDVDHVQAEIDRALPRTALVRAVDDLG